MALRSDLAGLEMTILAKVLFLPRSQFVDIGIQALKNIPLSVSTGVAFGNCHPQRGELLLVFALFLLQQAQTRAHHFAGIGIQAFFYLRSYKLVQFRGQVYVASRHRAPQSKYRRIGQLCQFSNLSGGALSSFRLLTARYLRSKKLSE